MTAFDPVIPTCPFGFPKARWFAWRSTACRIDLPRMCEPPKDEILQELVASFRRIEK